MAEKPTLNTVNPDLYSIYEPRDSSTRIQWGTIGKNLQGVFDGIEKDKADKKQKLDDESNALFSKVAEIELNADKTFSDGVLEMATNLKKNLMLQQKLMKDGRIPPEKFRQLMQKAKDQMAQFGIMAKSAQEYTDNAVKRQQDNTSGASETYIQGSNQGFNNLNGTVNWMDPGTNTAYIVRLDGNGDMPSYKDSPESYLPASYANNRSKYQYDRETADITAQTALYKDEMQKLIETMPKTRKVNGVEGIYFVSTEDVRQNKTRFKEMKESLFQSKFNYDDEVLSNAAGQYDNNFSFAQSEKEFKENNPGKDLKYWIKVDANSYPPKFEPNDRAFAEEVVRDASDSAFDQQMDSMMKIDGGMSFPQLNSTGAALVTTNNEGIGYLQRVNDIVAGDMAVFSSQTATGIQQLNQGKTDPAQMIDSVKRQGDQIIITYQNGKQEPVNRKDANGKIRTTKDLSRELWRLLTPGTNSKGQPMSFDDVTREFEKKRSYTLNTRTMSDAEITEVLKSEKAKANLIAGGNATPTPAEIDAEKVNVTVVAADIADARTNKLDVTYAGEDAVNFAARDPYKTKSAGEKIIRAQGDKLPTVSGGDHMRSKIDPNNATALTLPTLYYNAGSRRGKMIEGSVSDVFVAYLPSAIRKNSKIALVGNPPKIQIKYRDKIQTIPGVTDVVLNDTTTYVNLDKMLAEAAQKVVKKRNDELSNRKGGKPKAY